LPQAEDIYAHLSGQPFKQPGSYAAKASPSRNQPDPLGRALRDSPDKESVAKGFPLETWQLENESILGARLTREDLSGGRAELQPAGRIAPIDAPSSIPGATAWILGATTWVNVARTGQLSIGVRYLPGAVEAIRIRFAGAGDGEADGYSPAFLLQAVPALKSPPSLILPRGRFQADSVAEIMHMNAINQQVKMGFCVERGIDYERVSFTLL